MQDALTVKPCGQMYGTDTVLTNPYRKQETEEDATPAPKVQGSLWKSGQKD